MSLLLFFFFNETATTHIYTYVHTLSLHAALPIWPAFPAHDLLSRRAEGGVPLSLRPPPRGVHLVDRVVFAAGHRARRCDADHRDVGDERLPRRTHDARPRHQRAHHGRRRRRRHA